MSGEWERNPAARLEDELCEIHDACGKSFYFCTCAFDSTAAARSIAHAAAADTLARVRDEGAGS